MVLAAMAVPCSTTSRSIEVMIRAVRALMSVFYIRVIFFQHASFVIFDFLDVARHDADTVVKGRR